MIGQLSSISLELVALVVGASMVLGAVDILRQPGWAWKQAGEPRAAYLILDLLLPVIGLTMYIFRARPKVVAQAAGGAPSPVVEQPDTPAQSEPVFEPVPDATAEQPTELPRRPIASTDPFTGFREVGGNGYGPVGDEPAAEAEQATISSTFFSTGAATRSLRHPLALARGYRPRQRTSLTEDQPDEPPVAGTEPEFAFEPEQAVVVEARPGPAEVADVVEAVGLAGVPQLGGPGTAPARAFTPEAEPPSVIEPEAIRSPVVEVEAEPASVPEPISATEPASTTGPAPVTLMAQPAPTVPSGWKVDPSGRHQFRYWDGWHWTANVADDGRESLDALSA